jgi:hypothetical protein
LEVLARDCLIAFFNARPEATLALLKSEDAKKTLQLKSLDIETIAANGFDLRAQMGNIVIGGRDLSDLPAIRNCANAFFGAPPAGSALDATGLWLLNQRRHLIVHRAGFVDAHYLSKTGDTLKLGSRLELSPSVLEAHVREVLEAGIEIVSRARTAWASGS